MRWSQKLGIKAMAFIHKRLYQSKRLKNISFQQYLEDISGSIASSYFMDEKEITTTVDAKNLTLDIDTAITLGSLQSYETPLSIIVPIVGSHIGYGLYQYLY